VYLETMFSPGSVLVIGVSDTPGNLARGVAGNLRAFGFPGDVHMVGRKGGTLFGDEIKTSLDEVPDGIDLAMILTPARTVPDFLDGCGRKGIRYAVIHSGGFKELDDEGGAIEERLIEIAHRRGIRFVGPNCLGLVSPPSGLGAIFMPIRDSWPHGGVSVAAQSGGVGVTYLYGLANEHLGLARFASIGNKQDLDETDFLRSFAEDSETRSIAMYLEDFKDGRAFFDALRDCDKPVLVHKSNRSEASRRIAFSHTAALASDDAVVTAAIRQAGGIRVDTVNEVMYRLKALALPPPLGKRMAVISRSGGHAVIAADGAARAGFSLPAFPKEYLDSIAGLFTTNVISRGNPLDLGDLYDFDAYLRILEGAVALPDMDAVVMVHEYFPLTEDTESRKIVPRAAELSRRFGKPVYLVIVTDETEVMELRKLYDYPFFTSLEDAFDAFGAALEYGMTLSGRDRAVETSTVRGGALERIEDLARDGTRDVSWEGYGVLDAAGIDVPSYTLVRSMDDVPADFQFPVVAKVMSGGAVHKSDSGGVALGIETLVELERVVGEFSSRFGPFENGEGVLVQTMAAQGTEWIVGGKRDPVFGPIVMVGAGGILVEVMKDTAIRLAPVTPDEAREMIDELDAAPLLDGVRGSPPGDSEALARIVGIVSAMMTGCPRIEEIDLNPCIIHEHGATVVDVRMRLGRAEMP